MGEHEKELVVITGTDTGIGRSLAGLFASKGFSVAASWLNTPPGGVFFHKKADLRSEADIAAFAEEVKQFCAEGFRLRALIENAGMVLSAPVENMPLPALREVFEVNFFSVYSLAQKLIPLCIRDRSALFIVGSLAGRIGLPFFSPYVSSKFAVEGLVESLRREMRPFGVRTVLFEPGAVATPIWNNSWSRIRQELFPSISPKYREVFETAGNRFVSGGNAGMPSEKAAEFIYEVFLKKKPRARYLLSKKPWFDRLETLIPTGLMDALISKLFRMDRLKPEGGGE